jgi:hypothetical protein
LAAGRASQRDGLYWYFWSIGLAIEAVADAEILQRWNEASTWVMSLVLMALLTARRSGGRVAGSSTRRGMRTSRAITRRWICDVSSAGAL